MIIAKGIRCDRRDLPVVATIAGVKNQQQKGSFVLSYASTVDAQHR
jgi:hypothetical protein